MGEYAEMAMEQEMADMFDDVFSEIFGGKKAPKRVNRFIAHRKANDKSWMTRDGRELSMSSMESSHISRCIKLLEDANQTETKAYTGLKAELKHRETV